MLFRRPTLFAAALTVLLAPIPAVSLGYEADPVPAQGRVELVVDRSVVKLNYLLVLNRDETVGLDLRKAVQQFDEQQTGVRAMMRRLGERPVDAQLAGARKVGTVYFALNTLFVLPDAGDIARAHLTIHSGDRSYQPTPLMAKFKLDERPAEALLKERGVVGEAWMSRDRLILLVEPVLGGPMF